MLCLGSNGNSLPLERAWIGRHAHTRVLVTFAEHIPKQRSTVTWIIPAPCASRWFELADPGGNCAPGAPAYTGDYLDAFSKRIAMVSAGNPTVSANTMRQSGDTKGCHHTIGRQYVRGGYGLMWIHEAAQTITRENWPWDAPPNACTTVQPKGWPLTIPEANNHGRRGVYSLPAVDLGRASYVIEITDSSTGDLISTHRSRAAMVRPTVFRPGSTAFVPVTLKPAHGLQLKRKLNGQKKEIRK
jgi:hypothetical protein